MLRGRRNTLKACQCYPVVFSWQVQHVVLVRFAISWQVQHFVTWRSGCLDESHCQGCANMTQCQKSWQGQFFVSCLKSGGSVAKIVIFELRIEKCCREVLQKSVGEECQRSFL